MCFSAIQGKIPHVRVDRSLYDTFHCETLIHKNDSYQYDNSSHINIVSIWPTWQTRDLNDMRVKWSIPPTWHKRDLNNIYEYPANMASRDLKHDTSPWQKVHQLQNMTRSHDSYINRDLYITNYMKSTHHIPHAEDGWRMRCSATGSKITITIVVSKGVKLTAHSIKANTCNFTSKSD